MSEAAFCARRRQVRSRHPGRGAYLEVELLEDRAVPSVSNILVNDPALDLTSHDTQSETSMVLGPDNRIIVTFNDSGSLSAGPHTIGYAVSTNGGDSFTDEGNLPSPDGADPVLARSAKTGTVFLAAFALDFQTFQQSD